MDGTMLGPGAEDGLRSQQKEAALGAAEKLQGFLYNSTLD